MKSNPAKKKSAMAPIKVADLKPGKDVKGGDATTNTVKPKFAEFVVKKSTDRASP